MAFKYRMNIVIVLWVRILSLSWALEEISCIRNCSLCLDTLHFSGILCPYGEIRFRRCYLFWILFTCVFSEFLSGSINQTSSSWMSWRILWSTCNSIPFGSSSLCHFNLFRLFLTSPQHQLLLMFFCSILNACNVSKSWQVVHWG